MLENPNRKLHIDDLAKELNLFSSHFSRLFTKRTGHSPMDYFIQLKIQTACKLIDTTDWSIAKISTEIGLNSPFYFSRLFRKYMNMSPRAYRKRQS